MMVDELEKLFEYANQNFIKNNRTLFEIGVSERTLCGALMHELCLALDAFGYKGYYADIEYNRHVGMIRTHRKTVEGPKNEEMIINTDIIVHGRGSKPERENLIALEMKKSSARNKDKRNDRNRIKSLTRAAGEYEYIEKMDKYVFGYELGIYYEVNLKKRNVQAEFYRDGEAYDEKTYDLRNKEC